MSGAVTIAVKALLAASGVTALVSTRIEPDMVPQATVLPCIRVYLVAEESNTSLEQDHGPYVARVTVEAYAETSREVHAIAEAVKAAFETVRNQTIATKNVSIWRQGTDASFYDPAPAGVFRRATDFMVGWK
jgi:hypothetical protein